MDFPKVTNITDIIAASGEASGKTTFIEELGKPGVARATENHGADPPSVGMLQRFRFPVIVSLFSETLSIWTDMKRVRDLSQHLLEYFRFHVTERPYASLEFELPKELTVKPFL